MKSFVKLLLLVALLVPSMSWAVTWTNEPAGSSTILDCPFNGAPSTCGILDAYGSSIPDSDGSAPVSPAGVLRSTINAGDNYGGMQLNYVFPNGGAVRNEMYVGMMWRTNPQFLGRTVGNKMFFMRGPGSNGVFLFNNTSLSSGTGAMIFAHNTGGGLDNSHACSDPFGATCYPNSGGPSLVVGTWTKLEGYIKKSTTCTSRDGIVRWWINGVLVGNYTNLNYACQGLNEWVWSETWDGFVSPIPVVPWSHYIDHLYISIPNCPAGCASTGGGSSPPPPPPSPPPPPPSSGDYVFQSQFSGTQGTSQWSYRDTSGSLLTYDAPGLIWRGNELYLAIWSSGFHHGANGSHKGPVLRWTAPEAGTARITGEFMLYQPSSASGTVTIKHNSTTIFTQSMALGTTYPYDLTRSMANGDTIDFSLAEITPGQNDNTQLNPTISWAPTSAAAPTVSSFTPTSGAVGTSVTITGTNFVPSLAGNTVTFSDIAATVTAATATSITATVPPHALTGKVKVTTTLGTGTSAGDFTVPLSGAVEDVTDVTATALSTSSVTVRFTALSDGTGAAAKHDVRVAAGVISWGTASSVASGTCSTPFAPGVMNTVVTCTITGLTTGTQYDVQLVPYRGTISVNAVYGNISNIATVTTMGTIIDVPVICSRPLGEGVFPVTYTCPKPPRQLVVTR